MENGQYVSGSYFFYAPNKAAPVFFAVAFGASGLCHVWQCFHYKCFKLTALYPISCLIFTIGFAIREVAAFDYSNVVFYILAICLVYAAPPLLELANYHVLGRILYYVPYNSPLHPGRVLSTFTFLSGVVEALSGCGASFTANPYLSRSQPNVGPGLMKTALLLQIVVAMCFIALAVTFHRRCLRSRIRSRKVQAPLLTLYISTGIITIRTIYRTVEYFSIANLKITPGFNPSSISPVVRYEWFFYVFEATLMLVNCVLLNVRHPRRWLPESNKTYLAQDGVTELEGPGWIDTRPLIMTVLDPFDLAGTIKGKSSMSNRFWENNGFDNPGNGVETGKQEPQTV